LLVFHYGFLEAGLLCPGAQSAAMRPAAGTTYIQFADYDAPPVARMLYESFHMST
jgi:hypothetical protein